MHCAHSLSASSQYASRGRGLDKEAGPGANQSLFAALYARAFKQQQQKYKLIKTKTF